MIKMMNANLFEVDLGFVDCDKLPNRQACDAAEDSIRANHVGLWRYAHPVPPCVILSKMMGVMQLGVSCR
jgi:hypothetical protein